MDVRDFGKAMAGLSAADITLVAQRIESHQETASDDVEWWHATITIDRALKGSGRSRLAAACAHAAAESVLAAAERGGMTLPDHRATAVARAASEIARALMAGDEATAAVDYLLADFASVLGALIAR
jgi:hypothetical protein